MFFWIPRCWDSHAHLMYTGMDQHGLKLGAISRFSDLKKLKIQKHHFCGQWLVGFGWDQQQFKNQEMPSRHDLDKVFPDFPVFFTRRDGHAAWLNTKAIRSVKNLPQEIEGGEIYREPSGHPSGILVDRAMALFQQKIPLASRTTQKFFLEEGLRIFREAGFSHLRDMGGDELQWEILSDLDRKNKMNLYVEQNFCFDAMADFGEVLRAAQRCRRRPTPHLRLAGLKFFIDGALGSEGAWLSQPYKTSGRRGLSLWSAKQIEEILIRSWEKKFPVAIHALGDAAVEQVASVAIKLLRQGISGELNIEHAEVVQPVTIKKLARLKAHVHMQPCHWLSDRVFLRKKLSAQLYSHVFPWHNFEKAGVPISWGSDSPIEKPSVANNLRALKLSPAAGIKKIKQKPWLWHSHPDVHWGGQCQTGFDLTHGESPQQMIFDGQELFRSVKISN